METEDEVKVSLPVSFCYIKRKVFENFKDLETKLEEKTVCEAEVGPLGKVSQQLTPKNSLFAALFS